MEREAVVRVRLCFSSVEGSFVCVETETAHSAAGEEGLRVRLFFWSRTEKWWPPEPTTPTRGCFVSEKIWKLNAPWPRRTPAPSPCRADIARSCRMASNIAAMVPAPAHVDHASDNHNNLAPKKLNAPPKKKHRFERVAPAVEWALQSVLVLYTLQYRMGNVISPAATLIPSTSLYCTSLLYDCHRYSQYEPPVPPVLIRHSIKKCRENMD